MLGARAVKGSRKRYTTVAVAVVALAALVSACNPSNPAPSNVGTCVGATPIEASPSVYRSPGIEKELYDWQNYGRGTNGKAGLQWSNSLANAARNYASEMASKGVWGHACDITGGAAPGKVGENTSLSGSADALQIYTAYMNSPSHRDNILGNYTRVGIGAVLDQHGKTITVVRFDQGTGGDPVPTGLAPFGNLDGASTVQGPLTVAGWAIDPDTQSSIDVHIYYGPNPGPTPGQVGVAGFQLGSANRSRPDLAGPYPHHGIAHGFSGAAWPAVTANYACAYAIDKVAPVNNSQIGCLAVAH